MPVHQIDTSLSDPQPPFEPADTLRRAVALHLQADEGPNAFTIVQGKGPDLEGEEVIFPHRSMTPDPAVDIVHAAAHPIFELSPGLHWSVRSETAAGRIRGTITTS